MPMVPYMEEQEKLLAEIEAFLVECGMKHTAFGAALGNDTSLVNDLRKGRRILRLDTAEKIRVFIRTKRLELRSRTVRSA